jgi:hypothetical protein
MVESIRNAWRSILFSAAAVIAGGLLGITAAPVQASTSREPPTWTCAGTDECHAGTQECCRNNPDIPIGQGSCTTMCDVCTGPGCQPGGGGA